MTTESLLPELAEMSAVEACGKVYVTGGVIRRSLRSLASMEVYDPATDTCVAKSSLVKLLVEPSF